MKNTLDPSVAVVLLRAALQKLVAHDVANDTREGLDHCKELQFAIELLRETEHLAS